MPRTGRTCRFIEAHTRATTCFEVPTDEAIPCQYFIHEQACKNMTMVHLEVADSFPYNSQCQSGPVTQRTTLYVDKSELTRAG
jgi:hypothetical protein